MTGYRQMRRRARQARRAGMQPMMVIDSGNPFPDLVVVVIARWAWRYRSELAPLGVACLVAGLGWYAHGALSPWWPLILAMAGSPRGCWPSSARSSASPDGWNGCTWLLRWSRAGPGRRWPPRWAACLAAAASAGHRRSGAGGPVVGQPPAPREGPGGAHHRDLAWIANAIGLTAPRSSAPRWTCGAGGPASAGTWPDHHGRDGEGPAIESGFGTHRNAVRVHPTPDDLANRCGCACWTATRTLTRSAGPGRRSPRSPSRSTWAVRGRRAVPGAVPAPARHRGRRERSGKSGGLNELMEDLAACRDV